MSIIPTEFEQKNAWNWRFEILRIEYTRWYGETLEGCTQQQHNKEFQLATRPESLQAELESENWKIHEFRYSEYTVKEWKFQIHWNGIYEWFSIAYF